MKIAVASAFGWPYVRRGNRVIYELASYLADKGNEVHLITTKPGSVRRNKIKNGLLIKYFPVIDHPILTYFKIEYWQTFIISFLRALLSEDYDMVYTSLTMDSFGANLNLSLKGTPFVPILINGDPLYTDAIRAKCLFRRTVRKATRIVTISNFVNEILMRDFGIEGITIPCPVDTSKFNFDEKRKNGLIKVACTSTLAMERKRIPLLVKAFEMLREKVPNAILQLAGETTSVISNRLLKSVNERARSAIEFQEIESDEELVEFYRNATISVIPSLGEPFGMVTTESLASGTPVVGTRSGGTAEILQDPKIGVMIEPGDGPKELCEAMIKCINLAVDPKTARRCNEYAQQYSWKNLGPKYEQLQNDIMQSLEHRCGGNNKTLAIKNTSKITSKSSDSIGKGRKYLSLERLYVDTLDELDITSQRYYQIEHHKPRDVYVLKWIFKRGTLPKNILILNECPEFTEKLLTKFGFSGKAIDSNEFVNAEFWQNGDKVHQDFSATEDLLKEYDMIVCEDLKEFLFDPKRIFGKLAQELADDGLLIVTIPNLERYKYRTGRSAGGNSSDIQQSLTVRKSMTAGDLLEGICDKVASLFEIEGAAINNKLKIFQKSYITGKRPTNKTDVFMRVSLKDYLERKVLGLREKVQSSFRSHVFMAFKKYDIY